MDEGAKYCLSGRVVEEKELLRKRNYFTPKISLSHRNKQHVGLS